MKSTLEAVVFEECHVQHVRGEVGRVRFFECKNSLNTLFLNSKGGHRIFGMLQPSEKMDCPVHACLNVSPGSHELNRVHGGYSTSVLRHRYNLFHGDKLL